MKKLILLAAIVGFTVLLQGCAIYAQPYGYSVGYYGYAPSYGLGFNYWPHGYYSFRPYGHFGGEPGYYGWGGRHWGGWYGGGGLWGGHGGWHGRW